jgi:hypothetical protein
VCYFYYKSQFNKNIHIPSLCNIVHIYIHTWVHLYLNLIVENCILTNICHTSNMSPFQYRSSLNDDDDNITVFL